MVHVAWPDPMRLPHLLASRGRANRTAKEQAHATGASCERAREGGLRNTIHSHACMHACIPRRFPWWLPDTMEETNVHREHQLTFTMASIPSCRWRCSAAASSCSSKSWYSSLPSDACLSDSSGRHPRSPAVKSELTLPPPLPSPVPVLPLPPPRPRELPCTWNLSEEHNGCPLCALSSCCCQPVPAADLRCNRASPAHSNQTLQASCNVTAPEHGDPAGCIECEHCWFVGDRAGCCPGELASRSECSIPDGGANRGGRS